MEGTERRLYLCKSRPLSSVDILFPSHSTLPVIHYRSEQAKMFKDKLPCKVLSTLHYSETATAPTIPQIALLFTTISQDTPQYNLVGSQCYWFVETVWDALVKAFPPSQIVNTVRNQLRLFAHYTTRNTLAHLSFLVSYIRGVHATRDVIVGEAPTGPRRELWQLSGNWELSSCDRQDPTAGGCMSSTTT